MVRRVRYAEEGHTHPGSSLPSASGHADGEVLTLVSGVAAWAAAAGGGGYSRTTASKTTGSLANLAVETGTVTVAKGYRAMYVTVDRACRVRLYTSSAKRTADAARAPGTDPTGDHGVMLDVVMTAGGTLTLSPLVDGYTDDGTSAVPYSIQNRSGSTSTVAVTLGYVRTEA